MNNIRSEKVAIGAALEDSTILSELVADGLTPQDFSYSAHRRIWAALMRMAEDHVPIDPISVSAFLSNNDADFAVIIDCISGCVILASHARYHAKIIRESAQVRRLRYLADRIHESIDEGFDPKAIEERARQILDGAELRPRADFPTEVSHA